MQSEKVKIGLMIVGAVTVYSIGYVKGRAHAFRELGGHATNEAILYLAVQDHIRYRSGS